MKKLYVLLIPLLALAGTILAQQPAHASLYSYFRQNKMTWMSCTERKIFAAQHGVFKYDCSAGKNQELVEHLKVDEQKLGFTVVTGYQKTLRSSMTAVQANIPVSSLLTKDNIAITTAIISPKVYLDLEPGTSKEEIVVCTTVSATDFTGCTRGLAFSGTTEAASTTLQLTHNAGAIVVISNVHYVYKNLVDIDTERQFVTGTKWFTSNGLVIGQGLLGSSTMRLYFCQANVTSSCSFIYSVPSSTKNGTNDLGWSTDGVNTTLFNASGTSYTSGNGITITNSVLSVNAAPTSTGGLGFIGTQLAVTTTLPNGLQYNADGLALATSTSQVWTGSTTYSGNFVMTGNVTSTGYSTSTLLNVFNSTSSTSSTVNQLNFQTASSSKDLSINGLDANTLATNSTTAATDYHYHQGSCQVISSQRSTSATGNQTIVHSLSVPPSYIRFDYMAQAGTGNSLSWGYYTSTTNFTSQFSTWTNTAQAAADNAVSSNLINLVDSNAGVNAAATVTTPVTSTYFTLNWGTNNATGGARRGIITVCK